VNHSGPFFRETGRAKKNSLTGFMNIVADTNLKREFEDCECAKEFDKSGF